MRCAAIRPPIHCRIVDEYYPDAARYPSTCYLGVASLDGGCLVRVDAIATTSADRGAFITPGVPLARGAKSHGMRVGDVADRPVQPGHQVVRLAEEIVVGPLADVAGDLLACERLLHDPVGRRHLEQVGPGRDSLRQGGAQVVLSLGQRASTGTAGAGDPNRGETS